MTSFHRRAPTDAYHPLARAAVRAAAGLAGLLLPTTCAGCGEGDEALCARCTSALIVGATERRLDGLRVHCAGDLTEIAAAVMAAIKAEGRTGLIRRCGPAFRDAVVRAQPRGARAAVVAIPTTNRSYRARGYRVVELLCAAAGVPYVRMLRPTSSVADQRSLGRRARQTNMRGAFVVVRRLPEACDGVIIVDDVVTTGATMRAAQDACHVAGVPVLGAAALFSTPRRNSPRNGT